MSTRCKLTTGGGHFEGHFGYRSSEKKKTYTNMDESLIKVIYISIGGGHFGSHLCYQKNQMFKLGQAFDKSNPHMKFGNNRVIND